MGAKTVRYVKVKRDGCVIAAKVRLADTFFSRLAGLLGKKKLESGEGLLLVPCGQIHTWFMAMPIDVIFLDEEDTVIKLLPALGPGRVSPKVAGACRVLEAAPDFIAANGLRRGDRLEIGYFC